MNSGHNVAPEPLEETLSQLLPEAQQVVLIGNRRSFLAALVTATGANGLTDARIQSAIENVNTGLPHYKQIRAFHIVPEPFTIESGLLTAKGKLKRDAIAARFADEIDALYQKEVRMKNFQGKTLSWQFSMPRSSSRSIARRAMKSDQDTLMIWSNSSLHCASLQREARALIISSARKEGFCAGADLA